MIFFDAISHLKSPNSITEKIIALKKKKRPLLNRITSNLIGRYYIFMDNSDSSWWEVLFEVIMDFILKCMWKQISELLTKWMGNT